MGGGRVAPGRGGGESQDTPSQNFAAKIKIAHELIYRVVAQYTYAPTRGRGDDLPMPLGNCTDHFVLVLMCQMRYSAELFRSELWMEQN